MVKITSLLSKNKINLAIHKYFLMILYIFIIFILYKLFSQNQNILALNLSLWKSKQQITFQITIGA